MLLLKKYDLNYYAVILGVSILAFILPCKTWNFVGESYSSIYGVSSIKSLSDFSNKKIIDSMSDTVNASTPRPNRTFLGTYRPALWLAYLIEYKTFGLNAYLYYLLLVLIHIINSFLLFYLLKPLFNGLIALFCTLFFTVNPTLFVWFGDISRHQNQLSLFLFLLSVLFLKKILTTTKTNIFWVFLSALSYLLCILIRETFVIAPFLAALAVPFFYKQKQIRKKICSITFILAAVFSVYLLMRLSSCPFTVESSQNIFSLCEKMPLIIFKNFFYYLKELYLSIVSVFFYHKFCLFCENHNWIFEYKIIKNSLLLALTILFIINKQKKMFLYLFLCFILVLWPFFFIKAVSSINVLCYFYEALPFASAALGTLLYYHAYEQSKIFKTFFLSTASIFVIANTTTMISYQRACSTVGEKFNEGILQLKKALMRS